MRSFRVLLAAATVWSLLAPAPALGHAERPATFPAGDGRVPVYRTDGPELVVCKDDTFERLDVLPAEVRERNERLLERCAFKHIQEAVDAVRQRGTRILVLPGIYYEEPRLAPLSAECQEMTGRVLSYEEQQQCPSVQNLVTIFGDSDDADDRCDRPVCDLQIEGTGHRPDDVVIDGLYRKLNGIRADRADGIYIRNLLIQRFEFNSLYMMETDGFAIDRVVTRWNDEYGILTFAVDHGLYRDCEAYGNGDSGLYPGSASDINGDATTHEVPRYAVEIAGCRSHHNALGYSGTAGNSVYVHDTTFDRNGAGWVADSFVPRHPGMPQDHARLERNVIASNNINYYRFVHSGHCDQPMAERHYENGVVCPTFQVPVGTGILLAGGNYNVFRGNEIYDNWRQGAMQLWIPAAVREEDDPAKQQDTSHHNRYVDNRLGLARDGLVQPNGVDFWWDEQGEGNCWADNSSAAAGGVTSDPSTLPGCDAPSPATPGNPAKTGAQSPCAPYDRSDPVLRDPPGCDWLTTPTPPAGRMPQDTPVERLAGPSRAATAARLSQTAFPGGSDAVVVARGDEYADALAGAPLAAKVEGPVLLAGLGGLPDETAAEVRRLRPRRAYLLGGTGALSTRVERDLRAAGVAEVFRVAGATRFHTAALVAHMLGANEVYVVQGSDPDPRRGWADAVAVSAVAAYQKRPILLTQPDALPAPTADMLKHLAITGATVVGGTGAVSAAAYRAVQELVPRVDRLSGSTRYLTSRAIADRGALVGLEPEETWFATGRNWPDALVAGPAAAAVGANLLLLDGEDLGASPPAAQWLDDHGPVLERIRLLGGAGSISDAVAKAVAERS